jgi:monofunctional biosynthetic peptidoglycan transglycosylase
MMRFRTICLGIVLTITIIAVRSHPGEVEVSEEEDMTRVLFDFADTSEVKRWLIVNDDVMGGLSEGEASPTEDSCLLFSGSISLENNGGFASVRSRDTDFGLSGYAGIRLRVMGDGRLYQFRLRRDRNLDGVAFKREFQTIKNEWIEIELPFTSFLPTFRGRILTGIEPLDPADIRQLGFLIADKKAGAFALTVDRIVAYE